MIRERLLTIGERSRVVWQSEMPSATASACSAYNRHKPGVLPPAMVCVRFFFQAEDGIRDSSVTGVQTCALPIYHQWILGAVGDPLVMHQPAAPLLDVDAELHRYELPRPASRPAWDGETHRLEVQKGERRRELGECRRERGLHHHATGLDRLHLARVDHRQLEIGGQVVERSAPARLILEHLLPLDAVQAARVVVGKRWPRAFDERALMRVADMLPDRAAAHQSRAHAVL